MLRDLQNAGYVERRREGRCNLYRIHPELAIGDPVVEGAVRYVELLPLIAKANATKSPWGASSRLDAVPVESMNERSLVARRGPS